MFKDAAIDKDEYDKALQYVAQESKEKSMPKGMVSLEKLYDFHNHFR